MKRFIVTKNQLIELQLQAVKWASDRTVERLKELDEAQRNCMKLEIPDWATHAADVRTSSHGGLSRVKLLQFCPFELLGDLPK